MARKTWQRFTGDLGVVVVVEEEPTGELCGPAASIPNFEPARTVIDEAGHEKEINGN
jgi:hypothetical protein